MNGSTDAGPYTQGFFLRLCLRHLGCSQVWVLAMQYAAKIKYPPKQLTFEAVFDNKSVKLFDARPNANRTLSLHIKQFLWHFNINFSDILETFIFCFTTVVHQIT